MGLLSSVARAPFKHFGEKVKMVAIKFFILLIAVLCEPKKSLVPQAILQVVRSNYGERPVVIRVFNGSLKLIIIDQTLKVLSSEKQLKLTPIDMTDENQNSDRKNCVKNL